MFESSCREIRVPNMVSWVACNACMERKKEGVRKKYGKREREREIGERKRKTMK